MKVKYFTLIERNILSKKQYRIKPNKKGILGILQPIYDKLKLIKKKKHKIIKKNKFIIFKLPIIIFIHKKFVFIFSFSIKSYKSLLIVIILLSFVIFLLIIIKHNRIRKYKIIGKIRKKLLKIRYEIKFKKLFYCLFIKNKRFKIIYNNYLNLNFILFIYFWIISIIEVNRQPFDIKESERELISGYNLEYGKISFTFIFLKEYTKILFKKMLVKNIFNIKKIFYFLKLSFIFIRKLLPRYRIDLIIKLCWNNLLPITIKIKKLFF